MDSTALERGSSLISDEYAAGFFDGEGTVYAATRNNKPSPTIMVCISNVVREPLDLLRQKWGGSIFCNVPKKNRQALYQWTIAAKMAHPFLRAILPHLIIKRDVVQAAIEYCELMKTPAKDRVDYSATVERDGRLWVSPKVRPEFRSKVDEIHSRIRKLNAVRAPFNATRAWL